MNRSRTSGAIFAALSRTSNAPFRSPLLFLTAASDIIELTSLSLSAIAASSAVAAAARSPTLARATPAPAKAIARRSALTSIFADNSYAFAASFHSFKTMRVCASAYRTVGCALALTVSGGALPLDVFVSPAAASRVSPSPAASARGGSSSASGAGIRAAARSNIRSASSIFLSALACAASRSHRTSSASSARDKFNPAAACSFAVYLAAAAKSGSIPSARLPSGVLMNAPCASALSDAGSQYI
mmetsp:Transcript_13805/g.49531  ORF Transcript_13805/g.49531 Transcript_13805/m.49531 type:complete len:244 (-) Transcript_13805:92-823(-)